MRMRKTNFPFLVTTDVTRIVMARYMPVYERILNIKQTKLNIVLIGILL